MISSKLLAALTTDLYPTDSSSPRYLVALIDMATLPEETQQNWRAIHSLGSSHYSWPRAWKNSNHWERTWCVHAKQLAEDITH